MKNKAILYSDSQRAYAKRLIDEAPQKAVVTVALPSRTVEQNAKVWAMLSDISKQCELPRGGKGTADTWKCLMMQACNFELLFEIGLDGKPFPMGFRSSQLTISQCADLIEFMYKFGAEQCVVWSNPDDQGREAA